MAESANTLLQSSIKIKHGRKWKSRFCVLVKLSPVSDQVILKFYKSEKEQQAGKELRREQIVVSAQNFCGIESCFRHPKNHFVLTVICTDKIALLSLGCHADLLDWYHKIRNQLTSASEFKCRVAIPNRGKLPPGPAMIYIYDNHFAITSPIPSQLYGGWSLGDVTRYGVIEDGFAFDVVATKDGGTFVVLCSPEQAERLKTHVDAATHCVSNRWSHISDTVSIHEETIPERRHISQEWQTLLARDEEDGNNGDDSGANGGSSSGTSSGPSGGSGTSSGPSLPGSPRGKFNPETFSNKMSNAAMVEFYKQQATNCGDTDEESAVRQRLLEDLCLNLPGGGAISPNGLLSPGVQTDADGNVVDIIELYRTLTTNTGATRAENSNGSEETTFINQPTYVKTPTKKTPIREQNYEIMASFDRFRNPMPVSNHQRVPSVISRSGTPVSPHKQTDNEYVNLPSPKKSVPVVDNSRLNSVTAATIHHNNTVNNEVTNATQTSLKEGATASLPRKLSAVDETMRAPPLAQAARTNSYRTLYPLDRARTDSNASTSSDAGPSLPTTPTGKSFPPPFENLTGARSSVRSKRGSKSRKNNAPVPFDHGDLVKPVGPIAMLSLETTNSGASSASGSESGEDVGHLSSSELLDAASDRTSSLKSRGRSLSRSRTRSDSCDNGHSSKDAIRPGDLPSPLPPDPLRSQLSGHLSDPSLLDNVEEGQYLELNDSGRGSPSEAYDFPMERRPASPTTDPSSIMSPFGKKMSLRRDSSKGSSIGTTSPSGPLASPTNYPARRKRCNTEPTAEFVRTPSSGSSTWSRSRSNSRGKSLDIDEGDGYLMMKPVYEEKLKRAAKGVPQSPIHGAALKSTSLRRSATVSGEVSAMSPRMNRTKRDRTLPIMHSSGTLTYRRARGNSEGVINPGDIPGGSTGTDRTKHHYGPALDPSLLKRLTHRLNKFASGHGEGSEQHEALPEVVATTSTTQFAIDPDNLGAFNNNIDQGTNDLASHKHQNHRSNSSSAADNETESFECMTNGYASGRSNSTPSAVHDHNANSQQSN